MCGASRASVGFDCPERVRFECLGLCVEGVRFECALYWNSGTCCDLFSDPVTPAARNDTLNIQCGGVAGGGGGSGAQKFVYQKWPDQSFPTVPPPPWYKLHKSPKLIRSLRLR